MKLEIKVAGHETFTVTPHSPKILPVLEVYREYLSHKGRMPGYQEQEEFWKYVAKCAFLRGVKTEKVAGAHWMDKGGNLPYTTFMMILEDGTRL